MEPQAVDPTPASGWRRVAVRPVLLAYAALEGVDAVMMSGSTARGDADRWSDVEVGVFWSREPTTVDRQAIGGPTLTVDVHEVTRDDAAPPWYDHVYLGARKPDGLMVEVVRTLTSVASEMLDRTLGSNDPDPETLDAIKGIVDGREISGVRADLVVDWQARAARYPRPLMVAIVERYGQITQFWRWRMLDERDNPLLLAREFFRIANQLLLVLHAVNGRYCGHPSAFKRLDAMDRELTIAPANLAWRLRAVFTTSTQEGAAELRNLVEETFDLVELHLSEVDVDHLRTHFRSERRPLDAMP